MKRCCCERQCKCAEDPACAGSLTRVSQDKLPADSDSKFVPSARWPTIETYQKRRITPLRDKDGNTVGFRPVIQQGWGESRVVHSTVYRITDVIDESTAMAMAQDWRDKKERELGIAQGQLSAKASTKFTSGVSLVVSKKPPYRAYWKWYKKGYQKVTVYMSQTKGYLTSYKEFVLRVCTILEISVPEDIAPSTPLATQYKRLREMGIPELPERRSSKRSED